MISRRKVLKMLSSIPLGGLMAGGLATSGSAFNNRTVTDEADELSKMEREQKKDTSIYESVGARPLINARGTVTIIGATRMLPEVKQAMDEATRDYVQLDELMDGVSGRLAELTGAEWGCVTSGASGAITVATAGVVTGGDPDKLWRLPNLNGLKNEVIIPSYSRSAYDAAVRSVGAKMVEVSNHEELEAALGPRTAMIYVLTGSRSEDGPLSLKEIASSAKPRGVPILADAAAEGLYVPNPHLAQGADLVAYSGGKYLQGPQCAGLLLGRKDLVRSAWIASAPHHGPCRGYKVGREEIMGMLAAVETWFKRDYAGEIRQWTSWLEYINTRLKSIPGVKTEINQPHRRSNRSPSLHVRWDMAQIPLTGDDVEQLLWDDNPRVAVSGAGSFLPFPPNMDPTIMINSSQLRAGEEKIIAARVYSILSKPPQISKPTGAPAFDIGGQWDLEMKFAACTENQRLFFKQTGNDLVGTHTASFAPRDLSGTLYGRNILVRSSCTLEGVRINYEFTGTVNDDTMEGQVSMGEYGMADWKAKRHNYNPAGGW